MQRPKVLMTASFESPAFFHQAQHWHGASVVMPMSARVEDAAQVDVMLEPGLEEGEPQTRQTNAGTDETDPDPPTGNMWGESEPAPSSRTIASRLGTAVSAREACAGPTKPELERVVQYIEDNLASTIRLHDLVQLTSMSQSTFCAAFKRSIGLSPHRYHLGARIRHAQAQLLSRPELQLAELARSLGFADQAHFGRVFRSFVGATPRVWACSNRHESQGGSVTGADAPGSLI